MVKEKKYWPSWRYGPNGAAQIFQSEDDVPAGWVDHPATAAQKDREEAELHISKNDAQIVEIEDGVEVDFTPSSKFDITPPKRAPRKLKAK